MFLCCSVPVHPADVSLVELLQWFPLELHGGGDEARLWAPLLLHQADRARHLEPGQPRRLHTTP